MKKHEQLLKNFSRKVTLNLTSNLKCLLVLLLALIFANYLSAQESRVWDYPVLADNAEWQNLATFHKRLNALNIPDNLLARMTTEDLFKTCLMYPFKMLFFFQDNSQKGYDFLYSVFNGFRELEKRKDTPKELIKYYLTMNPEEIASIPTSLNKGKFAFQFSFIEILLSQRHILENLTQNDLKPLLKKSIAVYEGKKTSIEVFSIYGLSTTCMLLSRILEQTGNSFFNDLKESQKEFLRFVEDGSIPEMKLADKIAFSSKEFLQQLEL
jgi:hypothetical protein